MGWYEQNIFNPFILEAVLNLPEVHEERRKVLETAAGDILEIGVGSGLNLPDYPASVAAITSAGPEDALHPYAIRRAEARGLSVAHTQGDARRLPFDAARFDVVVSAFVLCTIPDPQIAVREFARVLKRDGRLVFLEHVAARGGARRVFQRVLNAPMRALLCGCEVTRDTERAIVEGGFAIQEIDRYDIGVMPWLHRGVIRGVAARSPA